MVMRSQGLLALENELRVLLDGYSQKGKLNMAGSFNHCKSDDGEFKFNFIENMRDAYEACEEMYYMLTLSMTPEELIVAHAKFLRHRYKHWAALTLDEVVAAMKDRELKLGYDT
jgi:hypothetical protein